MPGWARWLIWTGYFALLTTVLLLPGSTIASLHRVDLTPGRKFFVAKSFHVGAYAGFAILSAWLFVPYRFRWMLIGLLFGHGILTEVVQNFIPRRSGSWYDVAFDYLGVGIGIAISWRWWKARDEPRSL